MHSVKWNLRKAQKIPSSIVEAVNSTVQLQLLSKRRYFQNTAVLPSNKAFLTPTSAATNQQQVRGPCQKRLIQILSYYAFTSYYRTYHPVKDSYFPFQKHCHLNITKKLSQIYFISQLVSKWGGGESKVSHILHNIFQSITAEKLTPEPTPSKTPCLHALEEKLWEFSCHEHLK